MSEAPRSPTAVRRELGQRLRAMRTVSRSEIRSRTVSWGLRQDQGRGWDHLGDTVDRLTPTKAS